MKALRFALPLLALALWTWIFYQSGFQRGRANLVKKYTEQGLECYCQVVHEPTPSNPVTITVPKKENQ